MAGPFQGNLRWRRPGPGKAAHGLDHPRAGELVLVTEPEAWFTYYYWLDDARAPAFARWWGSTAPGYGPAELFFDPAGWPGCGSGSADLD